jgi:hypothetical protein
MDHHQDLLVLVHREGTRKIVNADELLQLLTIAFPHLHPVMFTATRNSSIGEQVNIFRNARLVVGVSGAGLANTIYCEKGTLVLELLPAREDIGNGLGERFSSRHGYTYYWQLSEAALLRHWVVFLGEYGLDSPHITVQRAQFKRALGLILEATNPRPLPRNLRLWWNE